MKIKLYQNDLPDGLDLGPVVAIDTETLGLNPFRDRLCLAQLSSGDGVCHAVQFAAGNYAAPNLKKMLADPNVTKLFHFARFDVAMFRRHLTLVCKPVYCTKIASKLVRTYTDKHGLKDLVRELLGVELSKEQQSSDWGAKDLTQKQLSYAANDVAYLHQLKKVLDAMLVREGRTHLAQAELRLPAQPRRARPGWLGRRSDFRPLTVFSFRKKIEPLPGEHAEALNYPNGRVYRIAGQFNPDERVPPEAIVGAWKVDETAGLRASSLPIPTTILTVIRPDRHTLRSVRFRAKLGTKFA